LFRAKPWSISRQAKAMKTQRVPTFNYLINVVNQTIYVGLETGIAEFTRLPSSERPQTRGQITGLRQRGSINQYWYYWNVAF
jgi:hypothetical protein